MTRWRESQDGSVVEVTRRPAGRRLHRLGLAVALAGLCTGTADAQTAGVVACPEGQAIRGINFVTRKLICVNVAAATAPAVRVTHLASHYVPPNTNSGPVLLEGLILPFDTELLDNADLHSTMVDNSRLTAPVDGLYLITVSVVWNTRGSAAEQGGNEFALLVLKNRTTYIAGDIVHLVLENSPALNVQHVSTVAKLSAGDFVEVHATTSTRIGAGILAAFEHSPEFSMVWVASD